MQKVILATPVLLALFPVLSLWRRNFDEVGVSEVASAAALAMLGGALVCGFSWLWLRDRTRSIVLASVFVALFFSHGLLADFLKNWMRADVALAAAGAAAVVLCVAVAILLRRSRGAAKLSLVLAWMAILLVVGELLALGRLGWQSRPQQDGITLSPSSSTPPASPSTTPPDIYYILLDGYARSDVMQELYSYDNTPFLQQLQSLGFHVTPRSRANYVKTLHALSAVLNMSYVQETVPVPATWVRSKRLVGSIQSNRVVHLLRQVGYSIHSFATGYSPAEFSNPDFHYASDTGLSEFHSVLLDLTPLPLVFGKRGDLHARHRQRLHAILDKLPAIQEGQAPRFVFAHLLAPHPPFVMDRHGEAVVNNRPFGYYDGSDYMKRDGTVAAYRQGYAEQARYVSERIAEIVEEIQQHAGDRPPIIIVHSDHGPGSGLDWMSVFDTDMFERFGILFATYLPGYEDLELQENFSPVNTFRLIFDLYFGTEMGALPARSFYTFQSEPFHYFDVTDLKNIREGVEVPASGW